MLCLGQNKLNCIYSQKLTLEDDPSNLVMCLLFCVRHAMLWYVVIMFLMLCIILTTAKMVPRLSMCANQSL